jgi:hypothetical protein
MENEKIVLFRKVLKIRGYSESSIANYVSALNKYIGNKGFDFSEKMLLLLREYSNKYSRGFGLRTAAIFHIFISRGNAQTNRRGV